MSSSSLLDNATRDLAAFAAEMRFEALPREVVQRIKTSLLDSLGCCLFGSSLPWTRLVADMADAEGAKPRSSVMGMGWKTSPALAALVNGTAGHAFELDDIHKESIVHAGSLAVPAYFAICETQSKPTGRDLVTAMAAGYEVGTRVGNAATQSLFFRGFHPQGTSGAFVAAATSARALGLDATRFQQTLGIVGSQAGGLMAAQEGAMVKRFHCGRAAQSGVYSALLAQSGFTGILDVLEASYGGYLSAYSEKPNPARITDGLGSTWEILQVGYKPHAAVTSIHTALDGLSAIMRENKLTVDDIAELSVGLSKMTHVHCAWEYKAQGITAAQMNLFYGLAVIAIDGVAFTDQYTQERLNDPRILSFIPRVQAYIDEDIDKRGAAYRHASRMKVTTRSGATYEKFTSDRRGSAELPLSVEDIRYKFRNVTQSVLEPQRIDRLIELCDRVDTLDSLDELLSLTQQPLKQPQYNRKST